MSEKIHKLLLRNLQEVFGEGDPTKRRSAIQDFTALHTEFSLVMGQRPGDG